MSEMRKTWGHTESPSVWREWIEILESPDIARPVIMSPSVWREWIEMCYNNNKEGGDEVSLRVEGVD